MRKKILISLSCILLSLLLLAGPALGEAANQTTINPDLQTAAEAALKDAVKISSSITGCVVVMDKEGRILALADTNPENAQNTIPMALSLRGTPGRLLTPLTVLAAMANGQLLENETISDLGGFDLYSADEPPTCWIDASQRYKHQDQTPVLALRNQCDYFFYTVASRTGTEGWTAMAKALGLDRPSGLSIDGEETGLIACQETLYDPALPVGEQLSVYPAQVQELLTETLRLAAEEAKISFSVEDLEECAQALMAMAVAQSQSEWVGKIREIVPQHLALPQETLMTQALIEPIYESLHFIKWGGTDTVLAAVGRSFTQTTPIAMARYWTAIGNGGLVYDASTTQADTPQRVTDLTSELGNALPLLQESMGGMLDTSGEAFKVFKDFPYRELILGMVASEAPAATDSGMSPGTWAVGLAPADKPEITVVVFLPSLAENEAAATIFCKVMEAYLGR